MGTIILHLDTSTKVCSVAISKNGELLACKETNDEGYTHAENLNVFIKEAVEKAGISLNDINAISIASGPGSYTGLRIGAATAKGLCYALNIPLIAIDSLTSLAQLGMEKHPDQTICPLLDARRMEVYNSIFDGKGTQLKEISADIIEESSYQEFEPFVFFGDGADKLKDIWKSKNCTFDNTILSSAKGQVKIAHTMYHDEAFVDTAYWEPFYLKDFIVGKKG